MDEHDDVRVLLDGAGLAQVGQLRPLADALLDRSGELREREHGDVELLREDLQPSADLRDLDLPVLAAAVLRLHQLQVVHDDEPRPARP